MGGGYQNKATGAYSSVGGGAQAVIADGDYSHIGGGQANSISSSTSSVVGGGRANIVVGDYGSVGGGWANIVGPMDDNEDPIKFGTLGGGVGPRVASDYGASLHACAR